MAELWQEYSNELTDLAMLARVMFKMVFAFTLGSVVGLNREHAGENAGWRTHILVTMAAAAFVMAMKESVPPWRICAMWYKAWPRESDFWCRGDPAADGLDPSPRPYHGGQHLADRGGRMRRRRGTLLVAGRGFDFRLAYAGLRAPLGKSHPGLACGTRRMNAVPIRRNGNRGRIPARSPRHSSARWCQSA